MKKILLIVSYFVSQFLFAQQEQQYSQYMVNQFVLNPAIAGTEDFVDLNMGYRKQWTGFDGSPKTYYVSGHGTIGKPYQQYHRKGEHKAWHGVGAQYFQDFTGPLKRTSFLVAYAYNIGITHKTRLSVGSYFGFKQLQTNRDYWKNIDDNSDEFFTQNLNTGLKPDLHVGFSLYNPLYYVNFSMFQLLGQKLNVNENDIANAQQGKLNRHAFFNAGLKFPVAEKTIISPSFMAKYVTNAPVAVDLNLKVTHQDRFWYGVSYRIMDAVNAFVGVEVHKQVWVSYAYEWSLTKVKKYNTGTHEIIVGLRLRHPKNINCPSKYW